MPDTYYTYRDGDVIGPWKFVDLRTAQEFAPYGSKVLQVTEISTTSEADVVIEAFNAGMGGQFIGAIKALRQYRRDHGLPGDGLMDAKIDADRFLREAGLRDSPF